MNSIFETITVAMVDLLYASCVSRLPFAASRPVRERRRPKAVQRSKVYNTIHSEQTCVLEVFIFDMMRRYGLWGVTV